jgi:hypothetical protein
MFWLPVGLYLGAIAIFIKGLIGSRVGVHQVCARCKYNLSGRPPTSQKCPECGNDLTQKRPVRFGDQRRQPRILILATVLLFGAIMLLVSLGGSQSGLHIPPITCAVAPREDPKPTGWLLEHATGSKSDSFAYRDQLVERLSQGQLTDGEAKTLANNLLAAPGVSYPAVWAQAVEIFRGRGMVSDNQWEQFWEQHTVVDCEIRAGNWRSKPIPIRITVRDALFSNGSNHRLPWKVVCESVEINSTKWTIPNGIEFNTSSSIRLDKELRLPPELLKQLHVGDQDMAIEFSAQASDAPTHHIRRKLHKNLHIVEDSEPPAE